MGILTATKRARQRLLKLGVVWLCALGPVLCPLSGGGEITSGEYALKAAFIFNFCKFVEWPDNAFGKRKEFCICCVGHTPLTRELAALSGKGVGGRTITFREFGSTDDLAHCQVLFISRSQQARVEEILDALKGAPVLTIADREDFCRKGGMLSLEKEDGRLVFDVNYREMQRARLRPNSQMLKLARRIYGRPSAQ